MDHGTVTGRHRRDSPKPKTTSVEKLDAFFPSSYPSFFARQMSLGFWPVMASNIERTDRRQEWEKPRSEIRTKTMQVGDANSVSRIDRVARILFPVTFICFNIFYWHVYLRQPMGTTDRNEWKYSIQILGWPLIRGSSSSCVISYIPHVQTLFVTCWYGHCKYSIR